MIGKLLLNNFFLQPTYVLLGALFTLVAVCSFFFFDLYAYKQRSHYELLSLAKTIGDEQLPFLLENRRQAGHEHLARKGLANKVSLACVYNLKGQLFSAYELSRSARSCPRFLLDEMRNDALWKASFVRISRWDGNMGSVYVFKDFGGFWFHARFWLFGAGVLLFILFAGGAFVAFGGRRISHNSELYNGHDKDDKALIDAFENMVRHIEERDQSLIKDKEKAEQDSRTKSDVLSILSHELRTPLHAILNFAEMARKKIDSTPKDKMQHYLSCIEVSGKRLARLVDSLLDLSKLEEGKVEFHVEEADIERCVKRVCHELRSLMMEKEVEVRVDAKVQPSLASMDKERIVQVLVNLLSNALKFSGQGSEIIIEIDQDKVSVSGMEHDAYRVSVIDQGEGIEPGDEVKIFDKFVQSRGGGKKDGSGLGLAICKEIIQLHHGRIWAENLDKGGAKFSFVIPKHFLAETNDSFFDPAIAQKGDLHEIASGG